MRTGTINIEGKNYPYQILKTNNKTVRITFKDGTFIVKSNVKFYDILDFEKVYNENARLFKKLLNVKVSAYKYEIGEVIRFFDKKYLIVASLNTGIYGDSIFVNINKNVKLQVYNAAYSLMLDYFTKRTRYFCDLYFPDIILPQVKVQIMKSRYGVYHSRNHYITYSAYLAHYPLEVIDYVIVHELCHTKVLSHSKEFYSLLKTILPNYKMLEKKIKEERYIPS
jgi:hypothetical protein